eukprot:1508219-Rhodomonas_salina.2
MTQNLNGDGGELFETVGMTQAQLGGIYVPRRSWSLQPTSKIHKNPRPPQAKLNVVLLLVKERTSCRACPLHNHN